MIDEGVHDVKVAQSQGRIADHGKDVVEQVQCRVGSYLEELGHHETRVLDDFGDKFFGFALEAHGCSVEQELAEPEAYFEVCRLFSGCAYHVSLVEISWGKKRRKAKLTEEMSPFHLPSFYLFILALGESHALSVALEFQSSRVQLNLRDDFPVLERGVWMRQDPRTMIKIPFLKVERTSISNGETK